MTHFTWKLRTRNLHFASFGWTNIFNISRFVTSSSVLQPWDSRFSHRYHPRFAGVTEASGKVAAVRHHRCQLQRVCFLIRIQCPVPGFHQSTDHIRKQMKPTRVLHHVFHSCCCCWFYDCDSVSVCLRSSVNGNRVCILKWIHGRNVNMLLTVLRLQMDTNEQLSVRFYSWFCFLMNRFNRNNKSWAAGWLFLPS